MLHCQFGENRSDGGAVVFNRGEMPILAIGFGVLFLFAVLLPLPKPRFLDGNEQNQNKPSL